MIENNNKVSADFRQQLLDQLALFFSLGLLISVPILFLLDNPLYLPSIFLLIFVGIFAWNRRPSYQIRAYSIVLLFIVLGILVVLSRAEPLGGRLWMLIAGSLATVLLGLRHGMITLVFGFALLFLPYFWFHAGAGADHPHYVDNFRDWTVQILTGFIPSLIMVWAISFAFNRLVSTESQAQLVTENAVDIIWSVDLDSRFNFITPSVEQTLGYTVDEMLQMKSSDLVTDETVERIQEELAKRATDEHHTERVLDYEMFRKDGSVVWTENSFRLLTDTSGQMTGISGVTRDITERKQAESAQDLLTSQLQQAQKMESIGQLAGGIAHDFNNLLSIIIGNTELMQSGKLSQSETSDCLEDIRKAGDSASAVSKQLLTFSRNDPVALQPVDITSLIRDLTTLLERLLPKDISLQLDIKDDLPSAVCDPTKVEQILVNLVVNARDAIEGKGSIVITTDHHVFDEENAAPQPRVKPGKYVCIGVIDDGCGIEEGVQDRIFEPFFTSKPAGEGTGLGLSVIFGIVEQHNGFIHLVSQPGNGSRFLIFLPTAENHQSG